MNLLRTIFLTLLTSILFTGCTSAPVNPTQSTSEKLRVAASFYPLAELAQTIGGQHVELFLVTPAGAEPHEYEPTPRDLMRIQESDLLLLNGGGQDPWGDKIADELRAAGKTVVIMSEEMKSKGVQFMESIDADAPHELDPHIWLDPVFYGIEGEMVTTALAEADPENAATYYENGSDFLGEMEILEEELGIGLRNCQRRDFMSSHAAFSYLAHRFNLNQIAIAGLSPDAEPSAKELAELADLAKEKGITTIFFETLVSPKLAQTLASEIGAQVGILNPIEGLTPNEIAEGKNYSTLMRENLAALRAALGCI